MPVRLAQTMVIDCIQLALYCLSNIIAGKSVTCTSARRKRAKENEEESGTLVAIALAVEGDCVFDFCLERDSYDSGHSKTNEIFSVLIDG